MKSINKLILLFFFFHGLTLSAQTHNVAINVTEGGPFGVPGAEVILNGDTLVTDFWGGVLFQNIPNGTYPYSVTKDCFTSLADTVIVSGAPVVETAIVSALTYNVAINTLGNGPLGVAGAEVILNGDTLYTDAWGGALFSGLPNGSYPYTITLACYQTVTDTVVVNCGDALTFDQMTEETYNVAINTLGNGPLGVPGAEVVLNGDTLYTDAWGGALFTGLPNGSYPYTITLACYQTVTDTVVVNCGDALTFDQMNSLSIEDSIAISLCNGDTYVFGSQLISQAGVYTEVFSSTAGCDSTVILEVEVEIIDVQVSVSQNTISASQSGASYQWLNCSTNQVIPGQSGQSFTPTSNGDYAVVVDFNGCMDTSSCVTISSIGLEYSDVNVVNLYPNPTSSQVNIQLTNEVTILVYEIYDVSGRQIHVDTFRNTDSCSIDVTDLPSGSYMLRLSGSGFYTTKLFVKQ